MHTHVQGIGQEMSRDQDTQLFHKTHIKMVNAKSANPTNIHLQVMHKRSLVLLKAATTCMHATNGIMGPGSSPETTLHDSDMTGLSVEGSQESPNSSVGSSGPRRGPAGPKGGPAEPTGGSAGPRGRPKGELAPASGAGMPAPPHDGRGAGTPSNEGGCKSSRTGSMLESADGSSSDGETLWQILGPSARVIDALTWAAAADVRGGT